MPLGEPFRVNTYTNGWQLENVVEAVSAGGFVVTWTSTGSPGGDLDVSVQARLYDAGGHPSGDQFQVNAAIVFDQYRPSVAVGPEGRFVVAFSSESPVESIRARVFDAEGQPLGLEAMVNSSPIEPSTGVYGTAVAAAADGTFVVAWDSRESPGATRTIRARRLDTQGQPFGDELQVTTEADGHSRSPLLAASLQTDSFAMAWTSYSAGETHVFGRHYTAEGTPLGPVRQLSEVSDSQGPDLLALPDGDFLAAWSSPAGLRALRLDPLGAPRGDPFDIGSPSTPGEGSPTLTGGPEGGFLVSYDGGPPWSVWLRSFDASGMPLGRPLEVAQAAGTEIVTEPDISRDDQGLTLVTWAETLDGGSDWDIRGRLYVDSLVFTDGFESGDLSAWDQVVGDGAPLALDP
jgi:hypothetical protein